MRSSNPEKALQSWLAAERAGERAGGEDRAAEAEAALFELFESLPLLAPPAGFADRVLVRAGLVAEPAARPARDFFASRWVQVLLAACVAGIGLSALVLPSVFITGVRLGRLLSVNDLVRGLVVMTREVLIFLASAARSSEWVLAVGRALRLPLHTPPVAGALLGCAVVASLAFFVLRDLISRQRSWNYVDPR
jgi:hypothetical protein